MNLYSIIEDILQKNNVSCGGKLHEMTVAIDLAWQCELAKKQSLFNPTYEEFERFVIKNIVPKERQLGGSYEKKEL